MKRGMMVFILVAVCSVLIGCGQQPVNQSLPTVMPTDPATDSGTPTAIPTEIPTQVPLDRPTLPPTWTVSPVPTQPPTATADASLGEDLVPPTLVVCGAFVADRERSASTHTPGDPVQVFWAAVETAARYRVSLLDEEGVELLVDYTREPTYTFQADLFERGKRYAWSVYPEDAINQQMCFERGAEILPR